MKRALGVALAALIAAEASAQITVFPRSESGLAQQGAKLASDFTNATITPTNTALSVNVVAGKRYALRAAVLSTDSVAADGAQFVYNGGTATATNYRMHCRMFDTALLTSLQRTAVTGGWSAATQNGAAIMDCYGSIEPATSGTFILQAAQVAHTTGTLTVHRGSWLIAEEIP